MLEALKAEFKRGKVIYIAECISVALFLLFLTIGPELAFLTEGYIANVISITWLIVNTVAITIYTIYDFITILFKEQSVEKAIIHMFLFKVTLFMLFFAMNIFLVLVGSNIMMPLLAIALTYLMLSSVVKSIPNKLGMVVLGILWFSTFFIFIYFTYPILVMGLYTIIKNVTIVEMIIELLILGLSLFIFARVLKRVYMIIQSKES